MIVHISVFFLSIPLVYYFVWNPNLFLFRLCAQRKTPAKITFVVWMFYKKSPFPLSFNNFTNLITQYERRSINIKVLLSPKRPASTIDVIVHFDSLRVSPYSKLLIEQKISTHISSLSEESNECLFSLIPFYCKYVLTSWPQLRITWKLISLHVISASLIIYRLVSNNGVKWTLEVFSRCSSLANSR